MTGLAKADCLIIFPALDYKSAVIAYLYYGLVKTVRIFGENIRFLSDSGRGLAIVGFARAVPHL